MPVTAPTLRIRFDRFELDEPDARLRREGTPILLPPKAFAVLCTLARKPGVLVTKNDLLDAVWGHQHVSESVLKTTISELRAASERQLIWIAGEAGVGKTRLIESFMSELPGNIAAVGQCVEHFGTGEPCLPLLEAVKELCRREPDLVPIMRAVAPTWLVQMPWLVAESDRASLQREVAGAHPDRMVREMREMMDRYTERVRSS